MFFCIKKSDSGKEYSNINLFNMNVYVIIIGKTKWFFMALYLHDVKVIQVKFSYFGANMKSD